MDKATTQEVSERAREYAEKHGIPIRKAYVFMPPFDSTRAREHLSSLPEYDVIDIGIGGFISVEEKDG